MFSSAYLSAKFLQKQTNEHIYIHTRIFTLLFNQLSDYFFIFLHEKILSKNAWSSMIFSVVCLECKKKTDTKSVIAFKTNKCITYDFFFHFGLFDLFTIFFDLWGIKINTFILKIESNWNSPQKINVIYFTLFKILELI